MDYCQYYQAHIPREKVWLFVGILRSYEHLVFERTIDKPQSVFEFFVPIDMEQHFLVWMRRAEQMGLANNLIKLPNRLAGEGHES